MESQNTTLNVPNLFVALCGANGRVHRELAEKLKVELDHLKVWSQEIAIVSNVASQVEAQGFPVDQETTQDSQLAIEFAWFREEHRMKGGPCIFCRSVVDRMAYSRVCNLFMDAHFDDMLKVSLPRYTVLFYTPYKRVPENDDQHSAVVIDTEIRKIIRENGVPVQILTGNLELKTYLAMEAIKLKLGL